jgi:hypothetical protein
MLRWQIKRVNEINFACHFVAMGERERVAWLSSFHSPNNGVIYNLNFIKVTSAFPLHSTSEEFRIFKIHKITPTRKIIQTSFSPFSCLQHCYSNKYTKLNRICIEIGLKTLFSSLTALSLLLEDEQKELSRKNVAIRIAFQHLLAWTFISFDVAVLFNLIW